MMRWGFFLNCLVERKKDLHTCTPTPAGLTLSVTSEVAAVFDEVTITLHWLFDVGQNEIICALHTGDGQVIPVDLTVG